ncbi:hypothetical protein ABI59_05220 [Acidobacteria bacterium Mor1]|nr:hypothetical protein ABI59_05220 [Acidobacteria bacterium Mor1]
MGVGPPLDRCIPGSIGVNAQIIEVVADGICYEDRPTSAVRAEAETQAEGAKSALYWYVFDQQGKRPLAVCSCYE